VSSRNDEERETVRCSVTAAVEVRVEDPAVVFEATVRDVSRLGLFVEASVVLPVGTLLALTIVVEQPFAHLAVNGTVVRVISGTLEQPSGMGIQLLEASAVWERFYQILSREQLRAPTWTG
jgi:hypothetical protein